jgi:hypothetical protein
MYFTRQKVAHTFGARPQRAFCSHNYTRGAKSAA